MASFLNRFFPGSRTSNDPPAATPENESDSDDNSDSDSGSDYSDYDDGSDDRILAICDWDKSGDNLCQWDGKPLVVSPICLFQRRLENAGRGFLEKYEFSGKEDDTGANNSKGDSKKSGDSAGRSGGKGDGANKLPSANSRRRKKGKSGTKDGSKTKDGSSDLKTIRKQLLHGPSLKIPKPLIGYNLYAVLLGLDSKKSQSQSDSATNKTPDGRDFSSLTQDELKKAYRKMALAHHPDKSSSDERENFIRVQAAYEILSDGIMRMKYDSSLGGFDARIPRKREVETEMGLLSGVAAATANTALLNAAADGTSGGEISDAKILSSFCKSPEKFYEIFQPVFSRNSVFSLKKPVPLLGDEKTPIEDVRNFYTFWSSFESWRCSFSSKEKKDNYNLNANMFGGDDSSDGSDSDNSESEMDVSQATCREERRWMEDHNKKRRRIKLEKERQRVLKLIQLAESYDPRLKLERVHEIRRKADEKNQRKREKEDKYREEAEARQKEQDEKNRLEAEERKKKEQAEEEKKRERGIVKERGKKLRQRLKKAFNAGLDRLNGSTVKIGGEFDLIRVEEMGLSVCKEESLGPVTSVAGNASGSDSACASASTQEDLLSKNLDLLEKICGELEQVLSNGPKNSKGAKGSNSKDQLSSALSVPLTALSHHLQNQEQKRKTALKLLEEEQNKKRQQTNQEAKKKKEESWTQKELDLLTKAVVKFPGGTIKRWEQIQTMLNNAGFCRTTDEIIKKIKERNQLRANVNVATTGGGAGSTANAPEGGPSGSAATGKSSAKAKESESSSKKASDSGPAAAAAAPPPDENTWTPLQQKQLESALTKYPASLGFSANERWGKIADDVEGKTKKQCAARFKELREEVMKAQGKS